jgi:hypothetical protein
VPDLDVGITELTFMAWIVPTTVSQNGGIIEKTVAGANSTCASLFLESANNLKMRVKCAGVVYTATLSISGFAANQPLFVCGRWAASDNFVRINVQGDGTGTANASTATVGALDQGAGALYVGKLGTGVTYFLNGKMGPARIYKRKITDTEVNEHYHGIFKSTASIIAAWDNDEGSGIVSNDDTDFSYDLNWTSTPSWIKSTLDGRWDSSFGAPKVYFPIFNNETVAEYGTRTGYTTPNAAIAGGYNYPMVPSPATAQYVEVLDYGTTLPATKIVATLTSGAFLGSVTITPTISTRKAYILLANRAWALGEIMAPALGDVSANVAVARGYAWEVTTAGTSTGTPVWPAAVTVNTTTVTQNGVVWTARVLWTDAVGVWSTYTTAFRYTKITLDITGGGTNNVGYATLLNYRLNVKLINDAGMASCAAGDAGGTTVTFNVSFVDVSSITATVMTTASRKAVIDFVDAPNPTTFKILVFDDAGVRQTNTVSWNAKGV